MKIHRVVQMLGATTSTGKLADDMYDLNYKDYYSEADGKDIPISHMDFQHLIRAFIKMMDKVKYYKKLAEDNFVSSVDDLDEREKLTEQITELKKQTDVLVKDNSELRFQMQQVDRNQTVSKESYDIAWHHMELWKKRYESMLPKPMLGDVKMFSEIPNDSFGKSLVDNMKAYLNKDSYKMRVRGQYLDEETKQSEGWRKYERGQPIEKSKCLRVYIDTK